MNDEDFLHGYRPAGPPPELRARIAASSAKALAERPRLRDWLPVAAVAAIFLLFAALSYRAHVEIDARLFVPDDLRPVEQWLPEDPGGLR